MRSGATRARITGLAGPNGSGKSSVAGAMIRSAGGEYFNPDEVARRLLTNNPSLTQREANALAWREGKRLLERAIRERLSFVFETTLGGETMTRRWVRTVRQECLRRIIPLGRAHLRRTLREFVEHYERERNHQGLNNRLLVAAPVTDQGPVKRRERLGGTLNFYYRHAA